MWVESQAVSSHDNHTLAPRPQVTCYLLQSHKAWFAESVAANAASVELEDVVVGGGTLNLSNPSHPTMTYYPRTACYLLGKKQFCS